MNIEAGRESGFFLCSSILFVCHFDTQKKHGLIEQIMLLFLFLLKYAG